MLKTITAVLALGAALALGVAAPTASAACHSAHLAKCELHRDEARAHIPHHIRHGVRW